MLWITKIRNVLCENGFEQVWLFGCGQEKPFFNELRERLYSSFSYNWYNHLENSVRFSSYKQYKNCFEKEKYVDIIKVNIYRNAIAQFRMGVSNINSHKYRYSDNQQNWNCPFCTDTTETETHFLFECQVYDDVRSRYFYNSINIDCSTNPNLKFIGNLSEETVFDFAKFLFYAFKLRAEKLNSVRNT